MESDKEQEVLIDAFSQRDSCPACDSKLKDSQQQSLIQNF